MTFNRYIIASLFSHVLFVALLLLMFFNDERIFPVFDVDIVGPLEEEKTVPPKPAVKPVIPAVREMPGKHPPAEVKPETLYDQGSGSPTGKTGAAVEPKQYSQTENELAPPAPAFNKEGDTPLTPPEADLREGSRRLDRGESGTPVEKGPSIVPPSALFDKKVIEKFAMKEPLPDKGLTFDTSEFRHRGYMRLLKEKIENIWQYPKEAARLGISGDLYLKFSIMKDGRLGEVEVLRTSGYKELDEAAVKALKDAEPYWPLPADWEKNVLEIKGHFIYVYGSAFVM